eukprot:SAG22_NODE_19618_length_273_cov_0.597701_1_plen_25_part_10
MTNVRRWGAVHKAAVARSASPRPAV